MKIYVFNSTEEWTCDVCHAIVAETEAEARKRLLEVYTPDGEYNVEEYEIEKGLVLEAEGYDDSKMGVTLP